MPKIIKINDASVTIGKEDGSCFEVGKGFYRLYTRSASVKKNTILAVVFAVATIGCMSTAVLSVVDKVVSSDVSSVSVGQSVGQKTGNFSGAVYKGFKEEIKKTSRNPK